MGFFDSLFGIDKKENISEMIPNPPRLSLAEGSMDDYLGGLDSLIDTFEDRRTGKDAFDFLKFVFEPQLNRLNQAFGRGFIGEEGMGSLGRRQGALGALEADMNRRGLLDSGVSGVLQGQLESQRAGAEADLFGQAKTMQRADIDAAMQSLANLFPSRFEAQNIPNQIEYENAMNEHNATVARNQATVAQRQRRNAQRSAAIRDGIGMATALIPGMSASLFSMGADALGGLFSQGATAKPGTQGLDLFGSGGITQKTSPTQFTTALPY